MNKMINEVREDPRNDLFCLMHWQTGSCHGHYLKTGMSKGIVPLPNNLLETYLLSKKTPPILGIR